jgi:hypothetical protein
VTDKEFAKYRMRGIAAEAAMLCRTGVFVILVLLWIFADYSFAAQDANTQKAVEQAAQKAAEKTARKVTEKVAEEAVEKAAEKAAAKAEEKEAAKAELTSTRPVGWLGPTEVKFFIFVVDVDAINDADQNFATNVYIRLSWKDYRLANPEAQSRQMPLNDVWNPRIVLVNQQGLVPKSLPEVVQVEPDGTVAYHQRYTGRLSQPLKLSEFPMDKHSFTIQFAAAGYKADELNFVEDTLQRDSFIYKGGEIAKQFSVPDWEILGFSTSASPYNPIAGIKAAAFSLTFEARRYVAYYIWQVILPLVVIAIMSWSAFWLDEEQIGARIGVATSAILTLIAYRFVLANLLPRLPYMTRMDYFTVGSTVLVLMVLIVVLWTSSLGQHDKKKISHVIDICARFGFPLVYVLLLGWFMYGIKLAAS